MTYLLMTFAFLFHTENTFYLWILKLLVPYVVQLIVHFFNLTLIPFSVNVLLTI
jgi:hypothetical protein